MDRNYCVGNIPLHIVGVALRKESVDRNQGPRLIRHGVRMSLSARRAWIEIYDGLIASANFCVALRKESVDRNILLAVPCRILRMSLSARRAWIEISCNERHHIPKAVALRKESVDRNISGSMMVHGDLSRSPQGERG